MVKRISFGKVTPALWAICVLSAAPVLAAEGPATATASAAEATLEALVTEALGANPELRFYQEEVAAARAGHRAASKLANPELAADIGYKRDESRGGQFLGDGAAWSVSVMQTFDFPGRMALRKALANRQVEAAELGVDQFRAGLAARVRKLAFAVLAAQENVRVSREVLDRAQALLAVLVQRDPAGVTPLLETRAIEANTVTLQRRASLAEQALQAAILELNQARGQALEAPVKVARTELKFSPLPPLEELLATARINNFDLRMRKLELEQQGFQVSLSRKERWPSVKVGPFYSSERGADQQSVVGVGLSIPVPLWDAKKSSTEQARARQQQAATMLEMTQRQVERQVTEHTLAYQKQLAEMGRWRTNAVEQFGEAAALGDRHYRLGSLPVGTYLELQKQYLDATEALLATQAEALANRQEVELLTGMSLAAVPMTGTTGTQP